MGSRRRSGDEFVEPMLPTLAPEPPDSGDWIHEIKYDGYRTQLVLEADRALAFTREGFDWSDRYRSVLDVLRSVHPGSIRIDGEMVVQDDQGRPDFKAMQKLVARRGGPAFVFYAFDLLSIDGADIRNEPLVARRARLAEVIAKAGKGSRIQFSEAFEGTGKDLFRAADRMGLEGIVSKRADSRYRSGRTKNWLKIKCYQESTLTIVGYERRPGAAASVLLAAREGETLRYAGRSMVTLPRIQRERLWRALEKAKSLSPSIPLPQAKTRRGAEAGAVWVKPRVKAVVRHLKGEDALRHATLVSTDAGTSGGG